MKQLTGKLHTSRWLLAPLALLLSLLVFFTAVANLGTGYEQEEERQLKEAIRRGAAACFADEGVYPDSLSYLKEHYGIRVDEDRYVVYYEVFAENLMPEITVLRKQEAKEGAAR